MKVFHFGKIMWTLICITIAVFPLILFPLYYYDYLKTHLIFTMINESSNEFTRFPFSWLMELQNFDNPSEIWYAFSSEVFFISASFLIVNLVLFGMQFARKNIIFYILMILVVSTTLLLTYYAYKIDLYINNFISSNELHIDMLNPFPPDSVQFSKQDTLKNIVFEPLLRNSREVLDFKKMISANDGCNIFIGYSTFNEFGESNELKTKFINILDENRDKINLFVDIEFEYEDISLPSQMALSTLDDETHFKLVYEFAKKLKNKYGVDYILGPVLDRKISTYEQTISTRSYGKTPYQVAENAKITILAFQHAGIQCIPKHFPGHPQIEKYDSNTHYGAYYTMYKDETLRDNAIPFEKVYENKYINIRTFMTDHIVIPSISKETPYVLAHDGVIKAQDKFLKNDMTLSFITDDLGMLIKESLEYENKQNHRKITPKTMLNIKDNSLSPTMKSLLSSTAHLRIDKSSSKERLPVTLALATLSFHAFRSGHDLVLMRGVTLPALNDYRHYFSMLKEETNPIPKDKFEQTINFPFRKANIKIDDIKVSSYPFVAINIVNHTLKKMTLSELQAADIFYYASAIERDDVVIGLFQNPLLGNVKKNITNIDGDSYAIFKRPDIPLQSIKHEYSNKQFDFYFFTVAYSSDILHLNELYLYLENNGLLDKLVIFIANSPDYLLSTARHFKLYDANNNRLRDKNVENYILNILHSTNVICLFENTHVISELLIDKEKKYSSIFIDLLPLKVLSIDVPGFYISSNRYKFEKDSIFPKISNYKNSLGNLFFDNDISYLKIITYHLLFFYMALIIISYISFVMSKNKDMMDESGSE